MLMISSCSELSFNFLFLNPNWFFVWLFNILNMLPAGAVWLEGGGDDDVAAWAELEAGEDLSVVDVGPRGALVVVVLEVVGRQPGVALVRPVEAESDLERNVRSMVSSRLRESSLFFAAGGSSRSLALSFLSHICGCE